MMFFNKKKKFLFFVCAFITANVIFAQEVEKKYLTSIIYLQNDDYLISIIKKVFKKEFKGKPNFIPFNLSNSISFLDIKPFEDNILSQVEKYGIGNALLNNRIDYRKKYYFEAFEVINLDYLIPKNDSYLYLNFSKPIKNTLILELSNFNIGKSKMKRGMGLRLLFCFDEQGFVDKVFHTTIIYN